MSEDFDGQGTHMSRCLEQSQRDFSGQPLTPKAVTLTGQARERRATEGTHCLVQGSLGYKKLHSKISAVINSSAKSTNVDQLKAIMTTEAQCHTNAFLPAKQLC